MTDYETYWEEKINKLFDYLKTLNLSDEIVEDIEDLIVLEKITSIHGIDEEVKKLK